MTSRTRRSQGMNWIRSARRLAIYVRDNFRCVWCGIACRSDHLGLRGKLEARLTLDHVKPYSRGGSNQPDNLVTSCLQCNVTRGDQPMARFASSPDVMARVRRSRFRRIDVPAAREMLTRSGGFVAACLDFYAQ